MDVSVLCAAFNEEESIGSLYTELSGVLHTLGQSYEILFVDDASTDGTARKIADIASQDPQVRGLSLLRNTRKGGALELGFHEAQGDIIITIDADMQDDPQEIVQLLASIADGADVVVGWKHDRKDSLYKRLPSTFINRLSSMLLSYRLHDMNSGLKAYRAYVVKNMPLPGSLYRFIPHLLAHKGFHVVEVPVHHRPRRHGVSKFSFWHRLRGLLDAMTVFFLTHFSSKPLHFFGSLGSLLFVVGTGFGVRLSYLWFQGEKIGARPLLLLSVLLIVLGMQFISIGFVGEMLAQQQSLRDRLPAYRLL